jgi:hypothetical protein
MSDLHIFVEGWQPFTNFIIGCDPHMRIRHNPRSIYRCGECGDLRQARNLEVQAYYDQWRVRCKDGKHPGWS